jgi:hypothetical protein
MLRKKVVKLLNETNKTSTAARDENAAQAKLNK